VSLIALQHGVGALCGGASADGWIHSPPHVHVIGKTAEAVFELRCHEGPVTLRESYNLKKRELRRLMTELDAQLSLLCDEWEKIHDAD
jgi:hypothetical protein